METCQQFAHDEPRVIARVGSTTIREMDTRNLMVGSDFLLGLEAVDETTSTVVMRMTAVKRAEVHMQTFGWATPRTRWVLLQEMHAMMASDLRAKGVSRVHTFLEDPIAFCRRLLSLGWEQTDSHVFFRWLR